MLLGPPLIVLVESPLAIFRAGTLAAAEATAMATGEYAADFEEITSGESVTPGGGDAVYIPCGINGEMRDDGDEPTVVSSFLGSPPADIMGEATPAP